MRPVQRDSGFTLVELIVVVVLIGIVALAIGASAMVILRASPATQFRIDDARATRGLETWLSYDVASAPPTTLGPLGGYDTTPLAPNSCGGPGENIAYLSWVEDDGSSTTYVVNYRLVPSGSDFVVIRYTCTDYGAGFGSVDSVRVATGIGSASCSGFGPAEPYAELTISPNDNRTPSDPADDYDEAELSFCFVSVEADTGLNAGGGRSQEILISVSSRNPSDFF